ncbi:MAG: uracil phosphoribosyltransferase [Akkermansiaceae bacterium]
MHTLKHPLIESELTALRRPNCPTHEFRQRVRRIASLMVPAVTADFETEQCTCETPLENTQGVTLARPIVLVPILRAGLGFLDGFLDLIPTASIAHIGLARNEQTLEPELYYLKCPEELSNAEVIVLDPMLATGGSAVHAVRMLKDEGASRLRFASLVAAPEGVAAMRDSHPDVPLFSAALDRCLNEKGYILPGLGDAGDRLFGTA